MKLGAYRHDFSNHAFLVPVPDLINIKRYDGWLNITINNNGFRLVLWHPHACFESVLNAEKVWGCILYAGYVRMANYLHFVNTLIAFFRFNLEGVCIKSSLLVQPAAIYYNIFIYHNYSKQNKICKSSSISFGSDIKFNTFVVIVIAYFIMTGKQWLQQVNKIKNCDHINMLYCEDFKIWI